ncbi:MAG: tyrosine--tRNA ligase [Gammaproteobacteria bacterium]|jgi:tyrosyl-tRNA synthetase|nr:tyrosine--tRNA ligase [Gammaproteobacteria bacterium]|tara:strand:+ start:8860 stop:10158 length:1299 start_codon:yes stop_codon:yes gene_type:complete
MKQERDFLQQMRDLGLLAQVSNEDAFAEHLASGSRTVYCGFDPTADSLHVGNLVPLLALKRFQLRGHRPILLVGGATGMIGDPGGRVDERELKSADLVAEFVDKIRTQASRFLDFDCGENSAILVDNAEWTKELRVIEFLRDIGKHFSVNAMMQKESVKRRLEDDSQGISYTEFSYMILQSYDFVVLNRRYGCSIQMGGSDQWGNITSGMDLIRRMEGNQAFAITYPLITKADGTKFGKSVGDSVWLDSEKTSPFSFYQFWRNCGDEDVMHFLKIFTFLDQAELDRLQEAHNQDPGARTAHIFLAREVTRLVHGEVGVEAAERITDALFSDRLDKLSQGDLQQLALDGMPATKVETETVGILDILVESGLAVTPRGEVTKGQARKLIKSNAVSVNGEKINSEDTLLGKHNAMHDRYHVIRKGKKQHHLVVIH